MPAVCTGSVTASLSQPDAPKIDRGGLRERQLGVVRASACVRLDVRPLLIAVETHSGGRPARSGYPSRPPALAVRPPVAVRLQGHTSSRQDCTADIWAVASGSSVRAPVHGRHKPCQAVSSRVENGAEGLVTTSFTASRPPFGRTLACRESRHGDPRRVLAPTVAPSGPEGRQQPKRVEEMPRRMRVAKYLEVYLAG